MTASQRARDPRSHWLAGSAFGGRETSARRGVWRGRGRRCRGGDDRLFARFRGPGSRRSLARTCTEAVRAAADDVRVLERQVVVIEQHVQRHDDLLMRQRHRPIRAPDSLGRGNRSSKRCESSLTNASAAKPPAGRHPVGRRTTTFVSTARMTLRRAADAFLRLLQRLQSSAASRTRVMHILRRKTSARRTTMPSRPRPTRGQTR